MTILEAITQADALGPNTWSRKQKVLWLGQLEELVRELVVDAHPGSIPGFPHWAGDRDLSHELFMPAPFDMAYIHWLEAQIHYANDEPERYNAAMAQFQSIFSAFQASYHRSHPCREWGRFRF